MNIDSNPFSEKSSLNIDYEQSYNDLLKKHNELKAENYEQKLKISLLEKPLENYKKINESLQTNMDILQKNLNSTNSVLKTTQKKMSEEIKILSLNKKKFIENQEKKLLSSVFSYNQLNPISKNKKRIRWTRDEVVKAFTLRYLSKRSYIYVKNELHYPLPGNRQFFLLFYIIYNLFISLYFFRTPVSSAMGKNYRNEKRYSC